MARSGQLERWFKSRQMQEQAQAVAGALAYTTEDKALFLAMCAALEVEVHPDDVSAIFDAPPEAGRHVKGSKYFDLYQELQAEHETLRDIARNRIFKLESAIEKTLTGKQNIEQPSFHGFFKPNINTEAPLVEFKDNEFQSELVKILKKSIKI